jgi:uncharacterized protein YjbJ (UPF0337 family)
VEKLALVTGLGVGFLLGRCGFSLQALGRGNEERQGDAMSEQKDTGPEAGLKGVVEGVKGKVKEAAGAVAGKDELRDEGRAQQRKADAERDVAAKEAQAERARAEAEVHEAEERAHQR